VGTGHSDKVEQHVAKPGSGEGQRVQKSMPFGVNGSTAATWPMISGHRLQEYKKPCPAAGKGDHWQEVRNCWLRSDEWHTRNGKCSPFLSKTEIRKRPSPN